MPAPSSKPDTTRWVLPPLRAAPLHPKRCCSRLFPVADLGEREVEEVEEAVAAQLPVVAERPLLPELVRPARVVPAELVVVVVEALPQQALPVVAEVEQRRVPVQVAVEPARPAAVEVALQLVVAAVEVLVLPVLRVVLLRLR